MKFENFKNKHEKKVNAEEVKENKEESNEEKQEELENLQEMSENLKDIEGMAVEINDLDKNEVAEKAEKNKKLKDALRKLEIVVGMLGVSGSIALGAASGSEIQAVIIGTAGMIGTAIATVAVSNKAEKI